VRITVLATIIALALGIGFSLLARENLKPLMVDSVDRQVNSTMTMAAREVEAGRQAVGVPGLVVRVLDTSGTPVDGASVSTPTVTPTPTLTPAQIRLLKAGQPVSTHSDGAPPWRWSGSVVSAPDGQQRLVVVGAALVAFDAIVMDTSFWFFVAAVLGALAVAVSTWLAVKFALRPVGKMRGSLRSLPAGERLPIPVSHDELRVLAVEFNALLTRQEQISERLRRFTGDAAHELRSPVASIRVQAEVAVANPDPELSQETLADILAETERLSGLLDGLMALTRSDAGELPPAVPVELFTEVRAAIERLPANAPKPRISGIAGQAWAHATHSEVELVLDNLLRNASRYADEQIVVSILTRRSTIRVVVDDDGPGIAPEHRSRVFDRFYRVSDDRSRSSGGAGLGLAMVAETVRRRGGRVAVGESPEGGARFQVTWQASQER
jgi:signal transduction histidine kinase